jgi:CheY-like chemotaxis protein
MKGGGFCAHVPIWRQERRFEGFSMFQARVVASPMPKILVVDDEPLIAMMIADWMTEQGLETLGPAHSVAQALALLETDAADAAILDVSLGDGDCYDLAEVLAAKGIPFAFATGHGADAMGQRFADVVTVSKPFDFEIVRSVVSKLLGTSPQD